MTEQTEILVEVNEVSKKFSRNLRKALLHGLADIFKSVFGLRKKNQLKNDEFWAIKNISFQLKRGECLGLIGHNGAGKSTLLKMLNGLIKPDEGEIVMRGRVCALIELGAGFNPVLTGRENIYVNGQILGLTKKEIESKLDAIIDFSEVRDFIDTPVMNYSSGMKVRLGFAVAAQMEPDVLIIDEVLAVGDMGFKLKCLDLIDTLLKNTAIIFVSHSMPMVSRICSRVILMDQGKEKLATSDVSEAISMYYTRFSNNESKVSFQADSNTELISLKSISHLEVIDNIPIIKWMDDLVLNVKFKCSDKFNKPTVTLYFLDKEQRPIGICINESIESASIIYAQNNCLYFECNIEFKNIQFSMGTYFVTFGLAIENNQHPLLRVRNAFCFQVTSKKHVWQTLELASNWTKPVLK